MEDAMDKLAGWWETARGLPGAFVRTTVRGGTTLLLLAMLGACSSTTFIYNRLDIILPWYLDDYVELNREQERVFESLLAPLLRWHRMEELPAYVQIIRHMESSLDREVTPEVVGEIFEQMESALLRLEGRALDAMIELGEGLSDEQIAGFLAVLGEEQTEYEEKFLQRSDEEYYQDSLDNFVDSLEDYLGRLNKAQKARLGEAAASLQRMDKPWLAERANWLSEMKRVLQRQPGWQRELHILRENREANYSEAYRQAYDHNLQLILAAVAEVIDSRTEKQDRRLRHKLKNLREDFETLVEQGAAGQELMALTPDSLLNPH